MRFGTRFILSVVVASVIAGASPAAAQQGSSWGDLNVSLTRIDYDLSGTGSAAGLAVRTTRDLSSSVRLELGGVFAKPEHQFVGPSTLFVPEAQLQYHWNIGRLSPYVGGGIGAAMVKSSLHTDWDPALSAAVGTGVRLTRRLGLTGEFRLRGHEWKSTGTTAELSMGLAWRLSSF
jgi:opacity protein-like surface antigen